MGDMADANAPCTVCGRWTQDRLEDGTPVCRDCQVPPDEKPAA